MSLPWLERLRLPAAIGVVLAFSFGWVWTVGHRGLFVFDESIAFDGAWRIAQGQVPYRDFFMPFGPVTFAVAGLIFRWVGVDFSSLVLTASLFSLMATALSLRLLWVLTRGSRGLSLLGAVLTAVWYQAPMGIPWMEQTAFLLNLLALLLVVEGRRRTGSTTAWCVAAGAASACAVLSKQNAGGFFLFVCAGALCLPWRGRQSHALCAMVMYAAGLAAVAALFGCWLVAYSDPAMFVRYWVDLSTGIGLARFGYWRVLGTLFFQALISSSVPLFLASSLVGAGALYLLRRRGEDDLSSVAAWCALSLPQFHAWLQLTTNNEAANNNAFVGICVGCACSLLARGHGAAADMVWGSGTQRTPTRSVLRSGLWLLAGFSAYSVTEGMVVAHDRSLHEFVGASFTRTLRHPAAARLKWGEPTRIAPAFCSLIGDICKSPPAETESDVRYDTLRRADFESIALELQRRQQNFFVFPDATILYGLSGRPSPQPLLYFHPNQSFAIADRAALDRIIVQSLRRNRVTLVVLERASFLGTHRLLASFDCLNGWIEANFELAAEYGNYRLLSASARGTASDFALPSGCEPAP